MSDENEIVAAVTAAATDVVEEERQRAESAEAAARALSEVAMNDQREQRLIGIETRLAEANERIVGWENSQAQIRAQLETTGEETKSLLTTIQERLSSIQTPSSPPAEPPAEPASVVVVDPQTPTEPPAEPPPPSPPVSKKRRLLLF